jgi:hypothetical protein
MCLDHPKKIKARYLRGYKVVQYKGDRYFPTSITTNYFTKDVKEGWEVGKRYHADGINWDEKGWGYKASYHAYRELEDAIQAKAFLQKNRHFFVVYCPELAKLQGLKPLNDNVYFVTKVILSGTLHQMIPEREYTNKRFIITGTRMKITEILDISKLGQPARKV